MNVRLLRRPERCAALALAAAILMASVLLVAACSGDDSSPEATPVNGDQQAVIDAVNRFSSALAAANATVLYSLQTESYKASCAPADFRQVVESMTAERLMGPVTAAIQGDVARADLFSEAGQPASLVLQRETDGSWRILTQKSGTC